MTDFRLYELFFSERTKSQSTPVSTKKHTTEPPFVIPPVVIPKFDGDYLKWLRFYDIFTELVHNQE